MPAPTISTPDYIGTVTPTVPHLAKAMGLLYLYLASLMVVERVSYVRVCGYVTRPDPRVYPCPYSLHVRLPLGLIGKSIAGPWLWLDVGLWESPSQCNLTRLRLWMKVDFTRRVKNRNEVDFKGTWTTNEEIQTDLLRSKSRIMRMRNYPFGWWHRQIIISVALKKILSLVKVPPPTGGRPVRPRHLATPLPLSRRHW